MIGRMARVRYRFGDIEKALLRRVITFFVHD